MVICERLSEARGIDSESFPPWTREWNKNPIVPWGNGQEQSTSGDEFDQLGSNNASRTRIATFLNASAWR
jgi:hypothetical protein